LVGYRRDIQFSSEGAGAGRADGRFVRRIIKFADRRMERGGIGDGEADIMLPRVDGGLAGWLMACAQPFIGRPFRAIGAPWIVER